VTISIATQEWLQMLSLYGWIWLVPVIERISPLKGQKFIRPGMINDLIHTYHRAHLWTMLNAAFFAWLVAYAQAKGGEGPYLRGALINAHWSVNFIAILLFGHVTFYAAHYACHKIPFLWQFHRVHHSSLSLDSLSTSRFHIIDKTFFAAPYLMLVTYFQPDPGMVFLFVSFNDFWGRYGHGNIKDPHWLGYFMSNPKFHRWHHSNHPDAIDKNFSAEFNFLDWIFGTAYYPKGKIPDDFGFKGYSNNIVIQHYQPFLDCYTILKKDGWFALFKKTEASKTEN
jgi:sterol desaturase/sphingolipid hydroxylase (fatty acid hydroxylase superfamily)